MRATRPAREGCVLRQAVIIQPDDGVGPVVETIEAARTSIALKIYTLSDERLTGGLIAARKRGVEVRVLMNPQRTDGSRDNDEAHAKLGEAGVEVGWSPPTFLVSHEKSLVCDDSTGLISTFNYAPRYFTETRDAAVLLDDPGQLAQIRACFDADWRAEPFAPQSDVGLLWAPGGARRKICAFIDAARESIWVQNPKLVDPVVLQRLVHAAARGVDVRFICAGRHGLHGSDRPATLASLLILRDCGGRVHVLKSPKLHCKLFIADKSRAIMGSMNIHPDAFERRRELSVLITAEPAVERLVRLFQDDWKDTHRFDIPEPLEESESEPCDLAIWSS